MHCQLITHLQLKKMLVMNESAHVASAFQLLKMSSHNTQPNNFECLHKVHFSNFFLRKISVILPVCIMKKSILKFRVNRIISVTGLHVNVYQIS